MIQAWEQHMRRHRGTGQDPKPGWLSPFSPRGSSQSEPGKLGELWNSLPSAQKKDKPAQPVLPVAAGSFSCRRGTGCADGGYPPPGRVCIGQKAAGWHTGQGCEGGMLAAGGPHTWCICPQLEVLEQGPLCSLAGAWLGSLQSGLLCPSAPGQGGGGRHEMARDPTGCLCKAGAGGWPASRVWKARSLSHSGPQEGRGRESGRSLQQQAGLAADAGQQMRQL